MWRSVNAAATHMYAPGIREHARRALDLGATKEELLEVLQLTSTLGIHAVTVGVPVLLDALGDREAVRLDDRRDALRADFEAKRGYWHDFWDGLL